MFQFHLYFLSSNYSLILQYPLGISRREAAAGRLAGDGVHRSAVRGSERRAGVGSVRDAPVQAEASTTHPAPLRLPTPPVHTVQVRAGLRDAAPRREECLYTALKQHASNTSSRKKRFIFHSKNEGGTKIILTKLKTP